MVPVLTRALMICFATLACMSVMGCATQAGPGGGGNTSTFSVFDDPASTFSTSDVYDVDNEIVRFNVAERSIVWVADGRSLQVGNWPVEGNFLGAARFFQVRFGNFQSERRAYFTETTTATICDLELVGTDISITATSTPVPQ